MWANKEDELGVGALKPLAGRGEELVAGGVELLRSTGPRVFTKQEKNKYDKFRVLGGE